MKLHVCPEEFRELITVVANEKHISESAVERDYYIVMMLKALADSTYAEQCVFKGGTSQQTSRKPTALAVGRNATIISAQKK